MVVGDFEAIENFYSPKDSLILTKEIENGEVATYKKIRSQYVDVINYLKIRDSLFQLKDKVKDRMESLARHQRLWEQPEQMQHTGGILGVSLLRQSAVGNVALRFTSKDSNLVSIFNIKRIPASYKVGYSLGGHVTIGERLFLGIDFTFTNFSYTSDLIQQHIYFNFNIARYSAHIYAWGIY